MVDLHDTQAFFKEHWRPIVIITVVVVAVIIAVSVTLTLTLRRKPTPSVSVSPFNGPKDINGDPPQSGNHFSYPQTITNPLPGTSGFGRNLFVHQAGYMATTLYRTTTSPQSMLFYYTNINGAVQGPQEIIMDFLPANYTVCNGMFAPIFNIAGEVYYLFVSVGVKDGSGNLCPRNVVLFSLDTSTTSNVWQVSSINTTFYETWSNIRVMKLPSTSFTPISGMPWYGTFGNKIQVVLDDNETIVKQSLYISGSELDPALPGGNLYWFVLMNNTVSPDIALLYTIQDAKLLMMRNQGNCPVDCPTCTGSCLTLANNSLEACMNGFASDFYVTSGNKSNNILVVANSTAQDNCVLVNSSNQPCAPKGYVQGYVLNSQGGTQSWIQPKLDQQSFQYRYIGTMTDPNLLGGATTFGGFANSVSVVNGKLVIGQAEPNSQGNGIFLIFDWTPVPLTNGKLNPIGTLNPSSDSTSAFPLTAMYPTGPSVRYNQGVHLIDDGSNQLLATSWYYPGPADIISVQETTGSSTNIYAGFATVQSLGAGYSSQTSTSPKQSLYGFAQFTSTWISRTGATVRMAFNDPERQSGFGRIIILTRNRQG